MAAEGDARLPGEAAVAGGRRLLRSEGEAEVGGEPGRGEAEGVGGLRHRRLVAAGEEGGERRLHLHGAEGEGRRLLGAVAETRRREGEAGVEGGFAGLGFGDPGRRGSLPLSGWLLDHGLIRCKDVEPTYRGDRTSRGGVGVQRREENGQHGGEFHVGGSCGFSGAGRQGKRQSRGLDVCGRKGEE